MRSGRLADIIFCILAMPGMMFLFPIGEWAQWHPGYVLGYAGWLYGVYFLCRELLGPLLLKGWKGLATVAGTLFLVAAVTFVMSWNKVDFPRDADTVSGRMELHQRAMWVLLLATASFSLMMGYFSTRIKVLSAAHEQSAALDNARSSLYKRSFDAVADEEILLKADYKTVHVPLSAIQFIESRNNYSCVHLDHQDDVVSQITLKKMMDLLPEGKFLRIHRSYIVPVWRIESKSSAEVHLMGVEAPLPVGRAFKDNLKQEDTQTAADES
ncbi:MAG: LytTR family transcriptional regulator [Bacteroidales bacterium]|nr:LytTR family transcriptional regulator [Bacteroidales bacterium]